MAVGDTRHDAGAGSFWLPLSVTGTAMFVFALDAGLLAVVLPEIAADFPDASRVTVSWVATGYSVAGVATLLIAGRLGDRFGRRRIFRMGMVGFAVGSGLTAIAPSITILLFARMVSGASGALYTATGLAIALREVPDQRKAAAVGFWGFIGSIGFVLGPTGGGALITVWSWRVAFAVLVLVAAGAAVAAGRVLHEWIDPDRRPPLRVSDVTIGVIGVSAVAVALTQTGQWGLRDWRVVLLFAGGLALLAALVARAKAPGALLDARLWGYRRYVIATAGAGVQQVGFLAWWVTTGFVVREVWGWTVLESGYALSLGMVVGGLSGLLGGRLADQFGYVGPTVAGSFLAGAGALFWATSTDTSPDFWSVYLPGLAVFMLGAGVSGILPTGAALQDIPNETLGTANATHSTVRRLCAGMGLAVMAAMLGEGQGPDLLAGAQRVYVMVAVAHLGLVPFMLWYARVEPKRETEPLSAP